MGYILKKNTVLFLPVLRWSLPCVNQTASAKKVGYTTDSAFEPISQ